MKKCIAAAVLAGMAFAGLPARAQDLPQSELKAIDAFLANYQRNVRVVKRTLGRSKEVVSCVDVRHQPGMNHPNATGDIQTEPSAQLKALLGKPVVAGPPSQLCPSGSIEMRLATRAQIIAAGGLKRFLSKGPDGVGQLKARDVHEAPAVNNTGHSYASIGAYMNAIAAQTTINVWQPAVVASSDFSLSQVWVSGGADAATQTIEAGVQVFPALYGNRNANFFIFFTPNAYQDGCYNLKCSAFIQTSNALSIGGSLPASVKGGQQVEGTIAWYRDPATRHWWLMLQNADGSYTQVGYYPVWLFGSGQLTLYATRIDFGGEVFSQTNSLAVPMGSGSSPQQFPTSLYGKVAYQRNLQWMDTAGAVRPYGTPVPMPGCTFDVTVFGSSTPYRSGWGTSMFFGGPTASHC